MKHLIHTLLAGALLSLPLLVRAEQPLRADRVQTGTVENLYVKVANGVFMDVRLMHDASGNPRNRLAKVPANTNVRQGDVVQLSIAKQSRAENSPADPAYLSGRLHCGPAL